MLEIMYPHQKADISTKKSVDIMSEIPVIWPTAAVCQEVVM